MQADPLLNSPVPGRARIVSKHPALLRAHTRVGTGYARCAGGPPGSVSGPDGARPRSGSILPAWNRTPESSERLVFAPEEWVA